MPIWNENDPLERTNAEDGRRETKRANQALRDYALMGTGRSVNKLVAKYAEMETAPTKNRSTLTFWSVVFGWVARTERFDAIQNQRAQEAYENLWKSKIMPDYEALGRLSEQARGNLLPFIRINDEGFVFFDFSHPDAKDHFHLIKKIKTKRSRRLNGKGEEAETWEDEWVEVELHDAQNALIQIGKVHKLFVEPQEATPQEAERQKEHDDRFDQSISKLAEALRESLSGESPKQDGAVGPAE